MNSIEQAYEKFCNDYLIQFKTLEEINFFDIFRAGFEAAIDSEVVMDYDTPEESTFMSDLEDFSAIGWQTGTPDRSSWYTVPYGEQRYFDGEYWYRQGPYLVDLGLKPDLYIVCPPSHWR